VEERLDPISGREEYITVDDLRESLKTVEGIDRLGRTKAAEARAGRRFARILSNPPLYVYMGLNEDYLVIPRTFCSCNGFIIQVVGEGKRPYCSHLAALEIVGDDYIDLSERLTVEDVVGIILELLYYKRSKILRRLVYGGQ